MSFIKLNLARGNLCYHEPMGQQEDDVRKKIQLSYYFFTT